MKKVVIVIICVFIFTTCYKEQINNLYRRQELMSEQIASLTMQINKINEEIKGHSLLIDALQQKSIVSNIEDEYGEVNGFRRLIAKVLTIGEQRIRIPFGQDGKNGLDAIPVSVSIDPVKGTWLIDGEDTNEPAVARTPILGVARDEADESDPKYYWTIKYSEKEEATYIKDSDGNRLVAKDPALMISPIISISKDEKNQTIIFHTSIKGLEEVVLPYKALKKVFKFDFSSLVNQDGASSIASYNANSNTIIFSKRGELLSFAFEKTDDLSDVQTSSNYRGFSIQIDNTNKRIYITAPSFTWDKISDEYEFIFTAQDDTRSTFTRTVKVNLKDKLYLSYFFNENPKEYNYAVNSKYNQLAFLSNTTTTHMSTWFDFNINSSRYVKRDIPFSYLNSGRQNSEILEEFRKEDYREIEKTIDVEDKDIVLLDAIFDPSKLKVDFIKSGENDLNTIDNYFLINSNIKFYDNTSKTMVFQDPLPWDTYFALSSFKSSLNSEHRTIRLRRAVMKYIISIENPSELFNLAASEVFDKSKLVLYTQNSYIRSFSRISNTNEINSLINNDKRRVVTKVDETIKSSNKSLLFDYDESKKVLTVSFSAFPSTKVLSYSVACEYTKSDGDKVVKILSVDDFEKHVLDASQEAYILHMDYIASKDSQGEYEYHGTQGDMSPVAEAENGISSIPAYLAVKLYVPSRGFSVMQGYVNDLEKELAWKRLFTENVDSN